MKIQGLQWGGATIDHHFHGTISFDVTKGDRLATVTLVIPDQPATSTDITANFHMTTSYDGVNVNYETTHTSGAPSGNPSTLIMTITTVRGTELKETLYIY